MKQHQHRRIKSIRKTHKGTTYRSTFEYQAALDFDRRGIKYKYEPFTLTYEVNEARKYTPDFALEGSPFYLEFKGWLTLADRKKALRVRRDNPEVEIRFVFQNSTNKIRKGSKTTYANWCDNNGFKWADVYVPQEWIDETTTNSNEESDL